MEISYKKEMGSSYLVLDGAAGTDCYEARILAEGRVECALPSHYTRIDGEGGYCFDISGLQSLEKYFAFRQADCGDLRAVMGAAAALPRKLEEYLISESRVLLTPQTVFVTPDGKDVRFLVCADLCEDYGRGMNRLAAFFLRKIDHQQEDCITLAYGLYEATAGEFSAKAIEGFFEDEKNTSARPDADPLGLDEDDDGSFWDEDGDDIFEEEAAPPAPAKTAEKREKLLKAAGIAAPVVAVIIVGLFMFL